MNTSRDDVEDEKQTEGEIIPPSKGDATAVPGSIYADIAAHINNYTERPDLLLEVIEKHDPGFIKEMNKEARQFSRKYRKSRFRFGLTQSYASMLVAVIVALGIMYTIYEMAMAGSLSGWVLIGFAVFYAVTQSGPSGFVKIAAQIAELAKSYGGKQDR